MSETTALLLDSSRKEIKSYKTWLIILVVGAYLVISNFLDDFKSLVDIATITSFIIAPIIAIVNFKLVLSKDLSKEEKPSLLMKLLSIGGIVYLLAFTILFISLKMAWIHL